VAEFFEDVRWETVTEARKYARNALSLDDTDPLCQAALGHALTYFEQYDVAGVHLDKAVSLNPNSILFAGLRANLLVRIGRAQEALEITDQIILRDPLVLAAYWDLRSVIMFQLGRYEEVIKSTSHKSPLQYWDHAYLAAAFAKLGQDERARAEAREVLRLKPDFSNSGHAKLNPFRNPSDQARLLDAFRMAGLPD
jgi:adenylate cyclase